MRIRLTDLSPQGLQLDDSISLESLNQRLRLGRSCDIEFLTPPRVVVSVFPTPRGAETKGKVTARYRQGCAACGDPVDRDLEIEANFILEQKPLDESGDPVEENLDDIGISFFEGDSFDLEELIQENLILSLSLYWHPPRSETGDCLVCGINTEKQLESGSEKPLRLGELLAKAQKR